MYDIYIYLFIYDIYFVPSFTFLIRYYIYYNNNYNRFNY